MKKFLCYDTNDAASGKVNVDSRGMLKPNSTVPSTNGASYQQLVTDGSGNTKWEDRLAYDDSRVVVDAGHGVKLVKVSDEIPSWASVDSPIKVWDSNGTNSTISPEEYIDLGNGSFTAAGAPLFITTDDFDYSGMAIQEKGVYFISIAGVYITGIASADSDTPEITWDGSLGEIKKIDEKFLPDDRFVVTFTTSEDGNIASDKTFAEIFDAYKSGKKVSGVGLNAPDDWLELYVSTVSGDEIDFFAICSTPDSCLYYVVRVSRTGGNSLISGLITQEQPIN